MAPLDDLLAELRAEGGLVAAALRGAPSGPALPEGPREEVALLLEAIREGYELHYGSPRLVDTDDADLALLAGDRLYALGLERLARIGDLDAVRALADLISACARAHAERRPEAADRAWVEHVLAVHRARGPKPGATGPARGAASAYPPTQ